MISRVNTAIPKSDPFEILVESAIKMIKSTSTVGSVEKETLNAAVGVSTKMVQANLAQKISNESLAVRSVAAQISAGSLL